MTEKEFSAGWISRLSNGKLKSFPENFFISDNLKVMELPGIDLIFGEELFGNFDLLDTKHNSVFMVDDYLKAKYIIYSNRVKPAAIRIPESCDEVAKMVKAYERHLDELLRLIETEFNKIFPGSRNRLSIINEIFNNLNIKRI